MPKTTSTNANTASLIVRDGHERTIVSPIVEPTHLAQTLYTVTEQLREPQHEPDPNRSRGTESGTHIPHAEHNGQLLMGEFENTTVPTKQYRFPAHTECLILQEKADTLPDLLFVPFEDAVKDVEMMGWEDLWVADARYEGPNLPEPRIDFVYNCTYGDAVS